MASVGGVNFITLNWSRNPQGEAVRMLERPGGDGVAFQRIGKRARPTSARGIADVADEAAVVALVDAVTAMRGSLQTVVEDDGTSTDYVMVHNAVKSNARFVLSPAGGLVGGNWLVMVEFVLQETVVV